MLNPRVDVSGLNSSIEIHRMAIKLILSTEEMGSYIYHVSSWNSVYIKFKSPLMRSIRVSDHPGRRKYRYKWNLVNKYSGKKLIVDRGYNRYFYSFKDIDKLIVDLKSLYKELGV